MIETIARVGAWWIEIPGWARFLILVYLSLSIGFWAWLLGVDSGLS